MLGIDMRMFPAIAEQKTKHSWLLPVLEAAKDWGWSQDEVAEDLLSRWIAEQAEKLYPESERAERIVREVLILLLEKEAISRVKEIHPGWTEYLPEVVDAREAALLGAREIWAAEEDEEAATDLLSQMESGSLQPSKELLSQIAKGQM